MPESACNLEQEAASVLGDGLIEELKETYAHPQVAECLKEVRHHILDKLDPFNRRLMDVKSSDLPSGV